MALTLTQTKTFLKQLDIFPKRKMGQNFLIDPSFVQRSIEWAHIQKRDNVIEIGPGLGTLTMDLLQQGARVFAVEKDPKLFAYLKATLPITICYADALDSPTGDFDIKEGSYKVVANLPYAIASVWLDKILTLDFLPQRIIVMVQKEAADRWLSAENTKNFCPLAIFFQSCYQLENKCNVPKRCFYPQPQVDSILLSCVQKEDPFTFEPPYKAFIRTLFTRRRQQLGHLCKTTNSPYSQIFLNFLQKENINLSVRPEMLPIHQWQAWACFARSYCSG